LRDLDAFRFFSDDAIDGHRGRIIAVVALGVAVAIFYFSTWSGLFSRWSEDSSYSHGLLILLTVLFLSVRLAATNSWPRGKLEWSLGIGAVSIGLVWMLAYFTNILIVQAMALPLIIWLAAGVLFGASCLRAFSFPMAYLYFAIPLWDYLTVPLQSITITVSSFVLGLLRVPAFIEGSFVFLPEGTFEIAEGCAGLHFYIVSLALSVLYAKLNLSVGRFRVLFVSVAMGLSLVVNWIRVTIIVLAGYYSNMTHYLVTVDHYAFGWILFVLMLIPLFMFGRYCESREAAAQVSNIDKVTENSPRIASRVDPGQAVLSLLVVAFVPLVAVALDRSADHSTNDLLELPQTLGASLVQSDFDQSLRPVFVGSKEEVFGRYSTTHVEFDVYANRYGRQRQGEELINDMNSIYDAEIWRERNQRQITIDLVSGDETVNLVVIVDQNGRSKEVFYWYWIDGNVLANPLLMKARELFQRMSGRTRSGVIAVVRNCESNCERRRNFSLEFLRLYIRDLTNEVSATQRAGSLRTSISTLRNTL